MYDIRKILAGWGNFVAPRSDIEALAKKRAVECSKCDQARLGKIEVFKDKRIKEISALVCNACPTKIKCPLSAKLRAPNEKCPLEKW